MINIDAAALVIKRELNFQFSQTNNGTLAQQFVSKLRSSQWLMLQSEIFGY